MTHSKDKEELSYKLGADKVVANGEELMKAGGADVILATGNSTRSMTDALKGIRPDGRMMVMGVSTEEPIHVSTEILFNRARIIGSTQNSREYLFEALDYVSKGKVKVITETYSLDDIGRAYDKVASGQVRFRAVIKN